MNFSRVSKIFLIILLILSAGCNKYQLKKRANSLESTLSSYKVALRWASYHKLYAYYVSPNGTQPPADIDDLEEVSVTGIDIEEKITNEEQTEVHVKMVVSYYIKTEGNVKKLKLDLKWWYNEPNNQWYIDGEFPKF